MKMRQTRLSMAVASCIAAAAFLPSTSFGFAVDVSDGSISTDSSGDTLIYPLYTVGPDGTTTTSFSLTNTDPDKVVVTKIRFREQTRSMDAMDFIIVLSPNDKYDFTVSKPAGSDRPVMRWKDKSCIVGPGQGTGSFTFPVTNEEGKNNNSYVYDETALDAGHIEILGLAGFEEGEVCYTGSTVIPATNGSCGDDVDLAEAATHVNGAQPPNCGAVTAVLKSQSLTGQLADALASVSSGDAPNSLIGRFVVTVPGRGIEAGADAMGIKNSNLPLASQSQALCSSGSNCVSRYEWDQREYDHPHLGDMGAGFDGTGTNSAALSKFQDGLAALNVAGDWSNNPANSVGVDWVMSFPSKYLYTDVDPDDGVDGFFVVGQPKWVDGTTSIGYADAYGASASTDDGLCLVTDEVSAWGVEEESGVGEEIVSPSPSATLEFCNETNILTFEINDQGVEETYLATTDADGDSRRTIVPFTVSSSNDVVRGWSLMDLPFTSSRKDAVSGIIFTTRDTDQATNNNGSITILQQNVGDASVSNTVAN